MASVSIHQSREIALQVETAGQRKQVVLARFPATLGRSDDCDVVISDFRVSRLHARLVEENGQYFITDAGSRRGTFVNSTRAERSRLKSGDEITLGVPGIRLVFLAGGQGSSVGDALLTRIIGDSEGSELEKLRLFLEASRSLSSGMVLEDALRNMLRSALRLTHAERGFVYLKEPGKSAALACGVDARGNLLATDTGVSHSVVEDAMTTASEFITGDTTQQSGLAARESIVLNELRTVVAVPLRARRLVPGADDHGEVSGVLYLDSRFASRSLTGVSHDVLRGLASECAAVLESARLVESERAAQQYRQELEIAASIQRSLISETETRCDFARVTGRSVPCKEVGGDFFDVHVSADAVTVIVADVSGKGIPAALLASVIHGMFYAQVSSGIGLVETVAAVNGFLCSRVAGQKYATLLAAQLQKDGRLQVVNCGHVPAIVWENGTVAAISDGDLPVGLMSGAGFHAIEKQFPPGSRLCILTDGISESEDAQGQEFGTGSIGQCLSAADPVPEIFLAVESFCGDRDAEDDRTVVLVERIA